MYMGQRFEQITTQKVSLFIQYIFIFLFFFYISRISQSIKLKIVKISSERLGFHQMHSGRRKRIQPLDDSNERWSCSSSKNKSNTSYTITAQYFIQQNLPQWTLFHSPFCINNLYIVGTNNEFKENVAIIIISHSEQCLFF